MTLVFAFAAAFALSAAQTPHLIIRHDPLHQNLAVEDRMDSYWKRALEEVYKSPEELLAQRERETRHGKIYPILMRGNTRTKQIALTFDDGPHPLYTPSLLAILRREDVKATFFVVGKQAEMYPNLIRAEWAGGHVVGNHTFSHVTLTKIPISEARTEYRACSDLIKGITGTAPQYCRPPGGDYDGSVIRAATDCGMTTVLWTDDPGDYASPGIGVIEKRTLDRVSDGGIILLHDGIQQTLDVLPSIIGYLKSKGFHFVTVDRLRR